MTQLPNNLYTAKETRELDRLAIEEFAIPGIVLMERAGAVAYSILKQHWPQTKKLCVVCGTGNNGGDGFVLARLAKEQGQQLDVFVVGDPDRIKGDALVAKQRLEERDVTVKTYSGDGFPAADVLVDAILGTGLKGGVEGDELHAVKALNTLNTQGAPILALDIATGLLADSGAVLTEAVKANMTVSFIGLNQGLLTAKGADCSGQLFFDDLQIPEDVFLRVPASAKRLSFATSIFKKRDKESHKGLFGHALIIGGDIGMSGAARMACEAALRSGTGLVSLATRPAHAAIINSTRPEIMSYPIEEENDILALIDKANVIAIGPGLGKSEWAATLFAAAINSEKPLVVDADALNLLADQQIKRENWILTPHPGEAARLLGCSTEEVQSDRFSAVKALSEKFGGTVILKGNGTLIYSDGETYLCDRGNPGMASGGMGDVLTGMVCSLLAQGFSFTGAANAGVYIHASAGDAAASEAGERGLLASDLMPAIRRLVNIN